MSILDIILLLCFIPAIVKGYTKGFINQLVDLVAILLGAWAALRFSNVATTWLSGYVTWNKNVVYIICFAVIILIVVFLLNLVGGLLTKAFQAIKLGWINRILGVALGIVKTMILLAIPVMIFQDLNAQFDIVSPEKLEKSVVYTTINDIANIVFPYFKSIIAGFTTSNA